ncbi:MAG: apolipoprotein N-acyltransferase [Hyphomicrobiaceae bacterium]|nr:apolipoprotein N-acyltransferase [Hyphomicrobiaceae bacterium]
MSASRFAEADHARPAGFGPSRFAFLSSPVARAAGAGWWFGFGYFVFGLFWLGEAFLVDAAKFAWLLPFAVTLMPAGLALFYAAAAALTWRVSTPGLSRILILSTTLGGAEWLRGHVLTGFPWNVLGYALTSPLPMMQASGLIGIYGLTLWTVVICAAPLVLATRREHTSLGRRWAIPIAVAVIPLAALFTYGSMQLARPAPPEADGIRLRIVQPSVPQREKWLPENQRSIFDLHLALSRTNAQGEDTGLAGITHVIWPEAAMPFFPLEQPIALEDIQTLTGSDVTLITGALRRAPKSGATTPEAGARLAPSDYDYFNAMMVFDAGEGASSVYDKIHLVPFGEYLPMQSLLEAIGLQQLTRLRGGFSSGPQPRPLLTAGALQGIGPLICYEAIFPATIVQGSARPRVLVNVTNDGWFGNTTGPRQHLHQTRVRAVEEGIPIVRAANNGISAMIDADGHVLARLDMDVKGVIDSNLPGIRPPPPYAWAGDWPFAANLLIFAALGLYVRRKSGLQMPEGG